MHHNALCCGRLAKYWCARCLQVYWWHEKYRPRKPKYFNRVHTGYEWNKYNQTHYDHDNPPPKTVQAPPPPTPPLISASRPPALSWLPAPRVSSPQVLREQHFPVPSQLWSVQHTVQAGITGVPRRYLCCGLWPVAGLPRVHTVLISLLHFVSTRITPLTLRRVLAGGQGYKFNIFFPDLIDKQEAPTYECAPDPEAQDGQTCLLRFHAGPPYEDIAFRFAASTPLLPTHPRGVMSDPFPCWARPLLRRNSAPHCEGPERCAGVPVARAFIAITCSA